MIYRERDAARANALVQRDFPECDLTDFIANPLNECWVQDDSGTMFVWRGPGIYEAHVFYAVRGREAIDLAVKVQRIMRERHGAWMFWSLLPMENRAARMFCRLIGWKSLGIVETQHGPNELFVSETASCPH